MCDHLYSSRGAMGQDASQTMVEFIDMRPHLASWNQLRSHHKSSSKVGILTKVSLSQHTVPFKSLTLALFTSPQRPMWWESEGANL